jgi:medium-chain acyl-[acyl-carrier-protein] hydrolase
MKSSLWFYSPMPIEKPTFRLFCLPYAGGSAQFFARWPQQLPGVEVIGIQTPGRGSRHKEAPFLRAEPLLDALTTEIRPLLDVPYLCLGYSLGAKLFFGLIQRLAASGAPLPAHFFVCASRAPQSPPAPPIYQLPDSEFISILQHQYKGIPPAVLKEPELLALFLPTTRADFSIFDQYVCDPTPLSIPISVFGGLYDLLVPRSSLEGR